MYIRMYVRMWRRAICLNARVYTINEPRQNPGAILVRTYIQNPPTTFERISIKFLGDIPAHTLIRIFPGTFGLIPLKVVFDFPDFGRRRIWSYETMTETNLGMVSQLFQQFQILRPRKSNSPCKII